MTSFGTHEPTPAEIQQWVDDLLAAIRDGWTPPLDLRLRFGLTADFLQRVRAMPVEADWLD